MDERGARAVVEARRLHPTWGPKKLVACLAVRDPSLRLPAPSKAGALLAREGLVKPRTKPTFLSGSHVGKCLGFEEAEHGIWSAYYYNFLLGRMNDEERTVYT
jgi:hypothetical protein